MKTYYKALKIACFESLLFFGIICFISCKKFVEIDPPKTDLITSTIFTSDVTAIAAISNIYALMSTSAYSCGSSGSFTYFGALSADELDVYATNAVRLQFAQHSLLTTNTELNSSLWVAPYQHIYRANAILEGLSKSTGVTDAVKTQLTGEAKFIRAFAHFYLLNMFGDVPLVLSTDYRVNGAIPRTSSTIVYQQIVTDLKDAQSLLANDYSFSKNERVRPNKWAATAMLARVYLYTKDWSNAEAQASMVINNQSQYNLAQLNNVFLKNSSEAIWQLVRDNNNTLDAVTFIVSGATPSNAALKKSFVDKFDALDQRRINWIGNKTTGINTYFFPLKYKTVAISPVSEYSVVLRLAEQYLIRAEARINQPGKVNDGIADLNIIRNRASLPAPNDLFKIPLDLSKTDALAALENERSFELFTEWGHRWLDLKRWPSIITQNDPTLSRADDVLKPIKIGWNKEDKLYPIPQIQIDNDPAMKNAQNPGYN